MRKALVFGISQEMGSHLCRALIQQNWEVLGIVRDSYTEAPVLSNLTLVEMGPEDMDFLHEIAEEVDSIFVHLPEAANRNFIFSMSQIIALAEKLQLQLVLTTNKYEIKQNLMSSLTFWNQKQPVTIYLPQKLKKRLQQAEKNGTKILVLCCGHSLSCTLDNGYLGMLIKETQSKVIIQSPGPDSLPHYWTYLPDLANNLVHFLDENESVEKPGLNITYYPGHQASINDIARCLELSSGKPVSVMPMRWTILEFIALFSPLFRRFLRTRTLWQHGSKPPASSSRLRTKTEMVHTPLELALKQNWRKLSRQN
ncbi:hypothetical protein C942_04216 [Photobacterium marinum]|uniref:NmrA-like domain-containing protein n=1 Tax=Photobacterium marinum TaxID=1056511 RepID=L8JE18_9GAMM|nr:NAD-dependent epimerase/dehydratase family protein [Photobacterium marinum]ELR66518.1 hypothetical protein C942_04216 [Photobacterium marinum]